MPIQVLLSFVILTVDNSNEHLRKDWDAPYCYPRNSTTTGVYGTDLRVLRTVFVDNGKHMYHLHFRMTGTKNKFFCEMHKFTGALEDQTFLQSDVLLQPQVLSSAYGTVRK